MSVRKAACFIILVAVLPILEGGYLGFRAVGAYQVLALDMNLDGSRKGGMDQSGPGASENHAPLDKGALAGDRDKSEDLEPELRGFPTEQLRLIM